MGSVPLLIVWAMFTLQPVTVSVYPQVSLNQSATFRITVLTPRHAENRNLCLGYRLIGEDRNLRDSCQSMDGLSGSRVRTVYWDVRSPGEYTAIAELTRVHSGTEKIYRSQQPFRVIGYEVP